jgi:hypothetical protein
MVFKSMVLKVLINIVTFKKRSGENEGRGYVVLRKAC